MQGSSTTHVSGPNGINLTLDFPTMDPYSTYAGPKVQSSLVFSGPGGNALTLGGILKQGTFRTSGTFGLQLAVFGQPGGAWSMVSGDGSCHVTIATASMRGISGTYHCSNVIVRKGKPPVDLSGAFSSAPPVS